MFRFTPTTAFIRVVPFPGYPIAPLSHPPDTAATVAGDEPLCTDCVRRQGLCRFHEHHVLPQLAQPSWTRMIGEPYVCSNADCEEHAKCIDVPGHAAPRFECGCHNCSQRRWARGRSIEDGPSVAAVRAIRRNQRRESKRGGVTGLVHQMRGGLSRRAPRARSAA